MFFLTAAQGVVMKSASKEGVGLVNTIDPKKPLIKEFVDQDREVATFLQIRLTHVPYCTARIFCVKRYKDTTQLAFRVNWYRTDESKMIVTQVMVKSQYVKVRVKPGGFEIIEVK
jgi:hypothetical protein